MSLDQWLDEQDLVEDWYAEEAAINEAENAGEDI